MRLFIGVKLTEEIRDALFEKEEMLKKKLSGGNYTRKENLHMTLHFLGEIEKEKAPEICRAIELAAEGREKFALLLRSFGIFNKKRGSIVWVGGVLSEGLVGLWRDLGRGLEGVGVRVEWGVFRPHVTLGRSIRDKGLERAVEGMGEFEGVMEIDKVVLFESKRMDGVLVYEEVFGCGLK